MSFVVEKNSRSLFLLRRIAVAGILLYAFASPGAMAQQIFSLVALGRETPVNRIASLPSYDPHAHSRLGDSIEILISREDVELLREKGVALRIVTPDMAAYYARRGAIGLKKMAEDPAAASAIDVPSRFRIGSAGGAYTLQEYRSILDSMVLLYPALITKQVIGLSVEGREIECYSITAPGESNGRRRTLLTGLHHAREPVSGMNVIFTMWSLLQGYGTDEETTTLLDNRRVDCVPVVNPDGYQKNLTEYPQGGGLWRKNLGAGGAGVDLNRNYGPQENWNGVNDGSNTNPADNNFRGAFPFSEPETQALRDLMVDQEYATILHHHAFGELLLHDHADHYETQTGGEWPLRVASNIAGTRGLGYGLSSIAIGYRASGTATEWASRNQRLNSYAWIPESGDQVDGFWPYPPRYEFLCRESNELNMRAIRAAGSLISIERITAEAEGLNLVLRNVGTHSMVDSGRVHVSGGPATSFKPLQVNEKVELRIESDEIARLILPARTEVTLRIIVDGVTDTREVDLFSGNKVKLFEEGFEGSISTSWVPDLWGIESVADKGRVLSDSPYEPTLFSSFPNIIELRDAIDLTGFEAAELSFEARGVLDARNYALRVVIVGEGIPGEGRVLGSDEMQIDNSPPDREFNEAGRPRTTLRGEFDVWQSVTCSLDQYVGKRIRVKFLLETRARGSLEVSSGVLIDDINIVGSRPKPSSVGNASTVVTKDTRIRGLQIDRDNARSLADGISQLEGHFVNRQNAIAVVDVSGRTVMDLKENDSFEKILGVLAPGTYVISGDISILVNLR